MIFQKHIILKHQEIYNFNKVNMNQKMILLNVKLKFLMNNFKIILMNNKKKIKKQKIN